MGCKQQNLSPSPPLPFALVLGFRSRRFGRRQLPQQLQLDFRLVGRARGAQGADQAAQRVDVHAVERQSGAKGLDRAVRVPARRPRMAQG